MMGAMIERVARAISEEIGDDWDNPSFFMIEATDTVEKCRAFYLDLARAAITAMREPTEGMVVDGRDALTMNGVGYADRGDALMCHQAMIDAALEEPQ